MTKSLVPPANALLLGTPCVLFATRTAANTQVTTHSFKSHCFASEFPDNSNKQFEFQPYQQPKTPQRAANQMQTKKPTSIIFN